MAEIKEHCGRKIHRTRFAGLGYILVCDACWRFVDLSDNRSATVGPQYRTKAELLADLQRYAREVWGY